MVSNKTYKYGGHEYKGQTLQSWMDDPSSSTLPKSKVQRSKVKYKDLEHLVLLGETPYHPLQLEDFGINPLKKEEWNKLSVVELAPHGPSPRKEINVWEGLVTRGILVIEEIKRTHGFYMSEISQAVYEKSYPIDTLEQIFILDVENKDTLGFVSECLYTPSNGLQWPDEETRYWDYDTPEFKALLGTKIGQTVAHIILGAFERGSRRISRIGTSFLFDFLQMRFEIQKISPPLPQVTEQTPDESTHSSLELKQRMNEWIDFFKGYLSSKSADSSNDLQPVKDTHLKHGSVGGNKEGLSRTHEAPRQPPPIRDRAINSGHNNDLPRHKKVASNPFPDLGRKDQSLQSKAKRKGDSSDAKIRKKRRTE